MKSLSEETQDWIDKATWLTDSHMPQVKLLCIMANEIDRKPTAQLANAYGVAMRDLMKYAPEHTEIDPLEALLNE